MWISIRKTLNVGERRAFGLHISYSIIEGFILGILALNEFVFIKSLSGSNYELGILFQFSMLVFLLLVFVNEFLKRIRRRRIFLRWVGIITRFPLLLLFFFPRSPEVYQNGAIWHMIFLAIFLVYYLAALVINPTINLLLKNNYSHQNFGTLYSYSQSANKVVLLVVTFLYGLLLDARCRQLCLYVYFSCRRCTRHGVGVSAIKDRLYAAGDHPHKNNLWPVGEKLDAEHVSNP